MLTQGEIVFHRPNEFHSIKALESAPNFFVVSFECNSPLTVYLEKYHTVLNKTLHGFISSIIKEAESTYIIPTKDDEGNLALLLSYCSEYFAEDLPTVTEMVCFDEDISEKAVEIYCIDKDHTNPYRTWERAGNPTIEGDVLRALREEGMLKPIKTQKGSEPIEITLSPNATYLITVK